MINPNESTIVIVGPPCAGKTHLTEQLAAQYPDYKIYHTDDYMQYGFERSIYELMEDIRDDGHEKIIIEGIQSARILRKGVELNTLFADLVIKLEAPEEVLTARYNERHQGTKSYPHQTAKAVEKVYNDYLGTVRRKPRIVTQIAPFTS